MSDYELKTHNKFRGVVISLTFLSLFIFTTLFITFIISFICGELISFNPFNYPLLGRIFYAIYLIVWAFLYCETLYNENLLPYGRTNDSNS